MFVASWCSVCFCAVLCVGFCTGHFIMVPLKLTCLHCLQHYLCGHLFNFYYLWHYFRVFRKTASCLFVLFPSSNHWTAVVWSWNLHGRCRLYTIWLKTCNSHRNHNQREYLTYIKSVEHDVIISIHYYIW